MSASTALSAWHAQGTWQHSCGTEGSCGVVCPRGLPGSARLGWRCAQVCDGRREARACGAGESAQGPSLPAPGWRGSAARSTDRRLLICRPRWCGARTTHISASLLRPQRCVRVPELHMLYLELYTRLLHSSLDCFHRGSSASACAAEAVAPSCG